MFAVKRIFPFLVAFFFLCGTAEAYPSGWRVVRGDSVRVFYRDGRQPLAKDVLALSRRTLPDLCHLLGLSFPGEAFIFLAEKGTEWENATRRSLPEWSQGVALPDVGMVFLKLDAAGKDWRVVLRHELVHVILGKNFPPGLIPRWFEEGLATFYSGEEKGNFSEVLSRANLTGSLIPLGEIEKVLQFERGKASLAYAESFLAVKLLIESIGWEGIRSLLQRLQENHDWAAAFTATLGMDEIDFEWYLEKYIREHYRWNFLLQSDFLVWVIVPFLAVVGFLAVRFRKYRRYRQWDLEERELTEEESRGEENQDSELP